MIRHRKKIESTPYMNRRELFGFASTFLSMLTFSSVVRAHQGDTNEFADGLLKIESGPGQLVTADFAHHHHFLEIPIEYIKNPPNEGVEIHTGWAIFENKFASFGAHYHKVFLSQSDLEIILRGEILVVEDTVKDHKYVLRLK